MQRFLKHRPVWGLFWANYGDLHGESLQQEILRDLLDLESDGVFDHTIMIIFSADHCQDGHSKRKTDRAFLDHHLPMMFIYLPPWFRKKYPKYAQSLHLNQQRLSSNFDVYNTLKHIIQMGKESNGVYKKSRDCPTCQSLFINLPWDRSCEKAGIPRDDCACQSNKEVGTLNKSPPQIMDQINRYLMKNGLNQLEVRPKDGHELPLGSLLVDTINDYLSEQKLLDQCHYLRLNSSKILHQFKEPTSRFGLSSYRVKFSTDPGNAQFLTTVNYNNNLQKLEGLNVDHFSRLDDFITTTNCMVKLKQKLFCICKNRTAKNISNAADKVDEKRKLRRLEYEKAYNQIKYRNQMLAKKRRAQGMWIWRKKQSYKHKHVGKK
ncbi:hypothetical protein KR018_000528 [Drosophila ironensis]|nr:hypothetical protein KR018_000528 [Drosophila ironensis]